MTDLVSYSENDHLLASKLTQVLNACECSKNHMIAIYLIDKGKFLYCNTQFQNVFGLNYNKLILGGWDFWYSLINPEEMIDAKRQLCNFFTTPYVHESLNLKYHISKCADTYILAKHEIIVHQLENQLLAINYFSDVTEKEKIEDCIESLSKSINSQFTNKNLLTISPREEQVLRLIADGFSSKEIANMLFISDHTAVTHRKNLIEKFQVKNTAHLIKKASALIVL